VSIWYWHSFLFFSIIFF